MIASPDIALGLRSLAPGTQIAVYEPAADGSPATTTLVPDGARIISAADLESTLLRGKPFIFGSKSYSLVTSTPTGAATSPTVVTLFRSAPPIPPNNLGVVEALAGSSVQFTLSGGLLR